MGTNQRTPPGTPPWPPRKPAPPQENSVQALAVEVPADLEFPSYPREGVQEALQRAKQPPRSLVRPEHRSLVLDVPGIFQTVLDRLRRGLPMATVMEACGITRNQWKRIEDSACRGVEPYVTWASQARAAQAEGVLGLLGDIRRAGEGDLDKDGIWRNQWQASKWLAEKCDPELQREPVQAIAIAHVEGELNLGKLSTEELESLYLLTAKAGTQDSVLEDSIGVGLSADTVLEDSIGVADTEDREE